MTCKICGKPCGWNDYCNSCAVKYGEQTTMKDTYNIAVAGVGPDAPTETNESGGMQSSLPYAFYLLDPKAMFAITEVLHEGATKYSRDNWRKIDTESHLNHALTHIFAWMAGDKQDKHLEHAFCRLMMAVAVDKEGK